jgi:hypothetical protein
VSALTSTSSIDVFKIAAEAAPTSTSSISEFKSTTEAASTSTSSMDRVRSTVEATLTITSSVDVVKSTTEATSTGTSSTDLLVMPVAEAQDATCTHDCCTVAKIVGKYLRTSFPHFETVFGCCQYIGSVKQPSGIQGVTCTSDGTVTKIDWSGQQLKGSIPPEIGNLVNLTYL